MTTSAIIVGLLTGPWLLGWTVTRAAGKNVASSQTAGVIGITMVFCFTGVGHFILTKAMAGMLPEWTPGRIPLVYATGVVEIAAAIGVIVPRWRTAVGWGLIAMLVLFLPVNVYAAVNRVGMGGHQWGPVYLLARVPLQALLAGWTYWFAVRSAEPAAIRFRCEGSLNLPPERIAAQILDVARWSEFGGYGPLPGIRSAEFEVRTAETVGSRIRVVNRDGSSHVEEIMEWDRERQVRLRLCEFSPPLCRLAEAFEETWEFRRRGEWTEVVRSFELSPRSELVRPMLWLISRLLKRAVTRHLDQLNPKSEARNSKQI